MKRKTIKIHAWDIRYLKHLNLPTRKFNDKEKQYLKKIRIKDRNSHREFTDKDWKKIKKQISYTDLIDISD
jgi:hypothetical protein